MLKKGKSKKHEIIRLVFLKGEWQRKYQFKKYFGTMLLPPLTWPISDPTVQKWVLQPRAFGTTFTVVSAKTYRFPKTRFWRNPGPPPKKHKNEDGRAKKNKFCHFSKTLAWGFFMAISKSETWKPHFPPSSGMCALYWQLRTSDLPEARVRGHRWKVAGSLLDSGPHVRMLLQPSFRSNFSVFLG